MRTTKFIIIFLSMFLLFSELLNANTAEARERTIIRIKTVGNCDNQINNTPIMQQVLPIAEDTLCAIKINAFKRIGKPGSGRRVRVPLVGLTVNLIREGLLGRRFGDVEIVATSDTDIRGTTQVIFPWKNESCGWHVEVYSPEHYILAAEDLVTLHYEGTISPKYNYQFDWSAWSDVALNCMNFWGSSWV